MSSSSARSQTHPDGQPQKWGYTSSFDGSEDPVSGDPNIDAVVARTGPFWKLVSETNHFQIHGWVRIPGAFSADAAAGMRDVVWRALASVGILREDPTTWRKERPDHLQRLKSDPAFRAVGSERTLAAIDEVLGSQTWRRPSDWGAFFLLFPTRRPWDVPADGWHLDADYTGPLERPKGVKIHAMFGDVAPRSGGMMIISGSHRLVHRWFLDHPPRAEARGAELRASIHRHPYLRDLCTAGEAAARIERFHERVEEDLGCTPRFLLNKDIYL